MSERDALVFLARSREGGRKARTCNNWIRELNLWSEYRGYGWRLRYFRSHTRPEIWVPTHREVHERLLRLTWPDRSTDARNRAILYLLADAGPRRQEVVNLRLQDLVPPPKGPKVWIRAGKGEKDRVLELSSRTWELIQLYIRDYRCRSDRSVLFTTPRGPVSYGYLGKLVGQAGKACGLPKLTCHKLRHFCVDDLLDHGVSVPSVAQQMGHSSWETVRIYREQRATARLAEEEIRRAAKRRFG